MKHVLIIQTAFIGDVVLATGLPEKLVPFYPNIKIDFLVRKGNESLLSNNPHINEVIIWNKKEGKYASLLKTIKKIRSKKYDAVFNLQRFFNTGLMTVFSGAKETYGFDKNPLSRFFSHHFKHIIDPKNPVHEIERNHLLISALTNKEAAKPKLYPSPTDLEKVFSYTQSPYVTLTPSSVWFTKRMPSEKWIELINSLPEKYTIYILGGKDNVEEAASLVAKSNRKQHISILAGKLSFLQSAALMKQADMNYVNDSAPLHFASAMDAPVTAIFCSTIPGFGFYPLSTKSFIVETTISLDCRPCGLHGWKACPLGHFKCGHTINTQQLLSTLDAN